VIVVTDNHIAKEMRRLTNTVPIVMAASVYPVEAGIVASLARPGGNITGFTANTGPEFEASRLQLLKEAYPEATHVAYLGTKSDWEGPEGKHVRAAAETLSVVLVHAEHTLFRSCEE
jgi:putative tryptophan/tyrosine transport system substrate-binding protein